MTQMLKTTVFSFFLVAGVLFAFPQKAEALFLDKLFEHAPDGPHCLFMDCDDRYDNEYQPNIVNSYNGNVNSLNGNTLTNPAFVSGTPTYHSGNRYPLPALWVNCYSYPTRIMVNDSARWSASFGGGNNNYYVTWSGSDGLSGTGEFITKTYYSSGTKTATVTVTSGGQTISRNCSSLDVQGSTYYPLATPIYHEPTYIQYPQYPQYAPYYPVSVTCRANNTFVSTGSPASWTAYASGGTGNFSYVWSGTDGLYGSGSTATIYYHNPGTKTAWVTVYSGGQQTTIQCSNSILVGQPYVQPQPQYPYYPPVSYDNLQIACAADTATSKVNQLVTWSAEATQAGYPAGGFTYSWSGSLTGTGPSVSTRYSTSGTKYAWITVTTPSGVSRTVKCSNSVYVSGTTLASSNGSDKQTQAPIYYMMPPEGVQAGLFSLTHVPWGWVAILVILVLSGITSYLIFNRRKI